MPTPYIFSATRNGATPAVESLEWLTDVQVSCNGTEARSQIRARPRYIYSCDIIMIGDVPRACMQALRQQTSFLVPLWPHVFERPNTGPTAGIAATAPQVMQLDYEGAHAESAPPITWGDAYSHAAPCAVARYAGTGRALTHVVTSKVAASAVAFRLADFDEAVDTYTGAFSSSMPSMPLLDPFTGAGGGMAEQVTDNQNVFDNGTLDLVESRYMERIYNISIVLTSREQIVAFRQLLFMLKGRLNPVRWTAPGDGGVERTWRLAADSVLLSYVKPSIVKTTLSLKQLSDY